MSSSASRPRSDGHRRRVLVLTGDHGLPDSSKWDGCYSADDLALHAEMRAALEGLAEYQFEFLSEHAKLLERLRVDPPELVLNFCDTGYCNVAAQELHVPALLELCGVPYSGAPPAGMAICYDKALVRLAAEALDVPTPSELLLGADEPATALDGVRYPALIKPNLGDGSVGITRDAVVRTPAAARAYLDWLRGRLPGRAALVQEYLPGPEYGLALVGNPGHGLLAFPPLEVDFSGLEAGLPPILAFESKTGPDPAYGAVRVKRAELAPPMVDELRASAEKLFARLQCRDYARFDFRAAEDGTIKLMEVNPNPAWSSSAKLAIMAGFAGQSYPELLAMILEAAETRLAAAAAGATAG